MPLHPLEVRNSKSKRLEKCSSLAGDRKRAPWRRASVREELSSPYQQKHSQLSVWQWSIDKKCLLEVSVIYKNHYTASSCNIHLCVCTVYSCYIVADRCLQHQTFQPCTDVRFIHQGSSSHSLKMCRIRFFSTGSSRHLCASAVNTSRCRRGQSLCEFLLDLRSVLLDASGITKRIGETTTVATTVWFIRIYIFCTAIICKASRL